MAKRGLGMRCPSRVAVTLREAGWYSHAGYWWNAAAEQRGLRWSDALAVAMEPAPRSSREPEQPRCRRTEDLFEACAA